MGESFRLQMCVRRQPGDKPIFFKVDGGRFDNEKTIKLNVNVKYSLELQFRPAQTVQLLNIQGSNVTVEEKKREVSRSDYTAEWTSSGLDASTRGGRSPLVILLQLKDVGTLKITLQCKFYGESEKQHSSWGSPCNYMEYEFVCPEGSSYVDVIKESIH